MKKLNFNTGMFEEIPKKAFENYNVGELREVVEEKSRIPTPPGLERLAAQQPVAPEWFDEVNILEDDAEPEKDGMVAPELNNPTSYKSEGEKWNGPDAS